MSYLKTFIEFLNTNGVFTVPIGLQFNKDGKLYKIQIKSVTGFDSILDVDDSWIVNLDKLLNQNGYANWRVEFKIKENPAKTRLLLISNGYDEMKQARVDKHNASQSKPKTSLLDESQQASPLDNIKDILFPKI